MSLACTPKSPEPVPVKMTVEVILKGTAAEDSGVYRMDTVQDRDIKLGGRVKELPREVVCSFGVCSIHCWTCACQNDQVSEVYQMEPVQNRDKNWQDVNVPLHLLQVFASKLRNHFDWEETVCLEMPLLANLYKQFETLWKVCARWSYEFDFVKHKPDTVHNKLQFSSWFMPFQGCNSKFPLGSKKTTKISREELQLDVSTVHHLGSYRDVSLLKMWEIYFSPSVISGDVKKRAEGAMSPHTHHAWTLLQLQIFSQKIVLNFKCRFY